MNERDLMIKRNDSARLLDFRMKGKRNMVNFGLNETMEHAMTKCMVCWFLMNKNVEFYTEAVFSLNKGRADVFLLNPEPIAIEVYKSENIEKATKNERYPCKVYFIEARHPFDLLYEHVKVFFEEVCKEV